MILTLLTDFGAASPYVAILKGQALKTIPDLSLIDLSHQIRPGDILEGQFFLRHCYREFPENSIHLAVVDPGVGTSRLPLAIQTDNGFFVGPDNGIFTFLREKIIAVHTITNPRIISPDPAPTFHGRDIFLPAALWLAGGRPLNQLGPQLQPADLISKPIPEPTITAQKIHGHIIYIDNFGNLISNIPANNLPTDSMFNCRFHNWKTSTLQPTYGCGNPSEPILTCSSFGLLEIALNGGSAADWFNIDKRQQPITGITISIQKINGAE